MARKSNQKPKLLYLLKIFWEQTDESHALRLNQIKAELERYGISTERKSLYDDIETLRVFGLDIKIKRDRHVSYYLGAHYITQGDCRIISDLLLASPTLSQKQKELLLKKTQGLSDSVGKNSLLEQLSQSPYSSMTEDAYASLCEVCKAISAGRQLTFKYFEWNEKKQRILQNNGGFFTVTPIELNFEGGEYTLVALTDKNSKAEEKNTACDDSVSQCFLLSGMAKASVSEKKAEPIPKAVNTDTLTAVLLRLRCKNEFANKLFSRIGGEATVTANHADSFEISVRTKIDDDFWMLLFSFGDNVQLLSPEYVRKEYAEKIEKIKALYAYME